MAYHFVKAVFMKWRWTYKELTLLAGILVALIILFALWFNQPSANAQSLNFSLLELKLPVKSMIDKTICINGAVLH